jgi:hypothetical protein
MRRGLEGTAVNDGTLGVRRRAAHPDTSDDVRLPLFDGGTPAR